MKRCFWANKEVFHYYHDKEWGVPVYDDRLLFEMLILEGAQAGLSWETILKRREGYKLAYENFDPLKVSKFNEKKKQKLISDSRIIRNKLKIEASIVNAKVFLEIQKEFGSFSNYIWSWTNNKVINNKIKNISEIKSKTELSDKISSDLKKRGMKFVGSTIIYAYLQAIGIVNDHETSCFRHEK